MPNLEHKLSNSRVLILEIGQESRSVIVAWNVDIHGSPFVYKRTTSRYTLIHSR